MKALTISQPYAYLIARGDKWVENRTWKTDYRGPIAIHAGKGRQYLSAAELLEYTTGAVVAIADLIGCEYLTDIRDEAFAARRLQCGLQAATVARHRHAEGPVCWILANVYRLPDPIFCGGKQQLWDWDCPAHVLTAFRKSKEGNHARFIAKKQRTNPHRREHRDHDRSHRKERGQGRD